MQKATADFTFVKNENAIEKRILLLCEQTQIDSLSSLGFAIENEAGLPILPHCHKDKIEVFIMVQGFQTFVVADTEYVLYQGDVLIVMQNEMHCAKESQNMDNSVLWFQLDLDSPRHFLGESGNSAEYLYQRIINFSGRKKSLPHEIIVQMAESVFLLKKRRQSDKIKGRALFIYCLLNLLDEKPVLNFLSKDIDFAKQYIITHVHEAIDIDELIGAEDISPSAFKKKFKEQVGMPVKEFINRQKIDSVKSLVPQVKGSFSELAYSYHFSTCKYMKLLFKRYVGVSPSKYRRQYYGKTNNQ